MRSQSLDKHRHLLSLINNTDSSKDTVKFKVGDKIDKIKGYKFPATIVAIFKTTKGETRIVAEMDTYGLLHIFNEAQLKKV